MDLTIEEIKTTTLYLDEEEIRMLLWLLFKIEEQEDDEVTRRHAKGLYNRIVEISNPFTP